MNLNLNKTFISIDDTPATVRWGKSQEEVDLTLKRAMLLGLRASTSGMSAEERQRRYAILKKVKKAEGTVEIKPSQIKIIQDAVRNVFPDDFICGQICDVLDGIDPETIEEEEKSN